MPISQAIPWGIIKYLQTLPLNDNPINNGTNDKWHLVQGELLGTPSIISILFFESNI